MPREYPEFPIPSVGVLVVHDGRALLVQRGNEPSRGRWTIPGGVVEVGETIHEAGKRELREECGIEVEIVRPLQLFEVITRDPSTGSGQAGRVRFHYIIHDMLGTYVGGELMHAADAMDARWFSIDDLSAFDVLPDVAALVREVLR
ncbi:MAG: NUDIX hydrolase [Chloroflexi bacterium]|nr:NUDIX hydrolase [Chloroflexota bacterium]